MSARDDAGTTGDDERWEKREVGDSSDQTADGGAAGAKGKKSDDENGDDEENGGSGKDSEPKQSFREWISKPRHALIVLILLVALVAGLIWLLLWWLEARKWEVTANAYIKAPIARLSPGVSGHVGQVFVGDNQQVRAGQPILRLSGASFELSVSRAEAELEAARAQLLQAQAAAGAARATVDENLAVADARAADAERARRDLARYASLSAAALAEQQRDRAAAEARSAAATARAARRTVATQRARVAQADADVAAARARVRQAEAALSSARVNQGDTLLVAPMDGRVTQFDVEPGDYLRPGQPVLAVVGHARWVEANFKETQLRLMRRGQHVEIAVDAWSDFKLPAVVDSVQAGTGSEFAALPRQNATANWVETTQRVPVRLRFAPDAFRDFPARADVVPGLSVEARVKVMP